MRWVMYETFNLEHSTKTHENLKYLQLKLLLLAPGFCWVDSIEERCGTMWCCEELLLHAQHTIFCYNLMQKYFHLNYRCWVRRGVVQEARERLRRGSQAGDHLINCGNSVTIFATRHTRGETTTVAQQLSAITTLNIYTILLHCWIHMNAKQVGY